VTPLSLSMRSPKVSRGMTRNLGASKNLVKAAKTSSGDYSRRQGDDALVPGNLDPNDAPTELGGRVIQIMNFFEWKSGREMSRWCGLSESAIWAMIDGGGGRAATFAAMRRCTSVNLNWLIAKDGEMGCKRPPVQQPRLADEPKSPQAEAMAKRVRHPTATHETKPQSKRKKPAAATYETKAPSKMRAKKSRK
jgi:hypothetical protein